MPVHTIQPSFSGGEFAPSLYSRVDLQKYATGLKRAKNMIVHPHGGLSNRPGLRYISKAKYPDKKCRLVPFEFSLDQAYNIEFGEHYCRFYANEGIVIAESPPSWNGAINYEVDDYVTYAGLKYRCDSNNINRRPDMNSIWIRQDCYEIASPYSEADIADLKFTQSADILYVVHPNHPPMELTRYAHDLWELSQFVFKDGPFMISNIDETKKITPAFPVGETYMTLTASGFGPFSEDHLGALFRIKHEVEGLSETGAFSANGTTAGIWCQGTWRIISHGTWDGKITVQKSLDAGTTWTELRSFTSKIDGTGKGDFNVNTFGNEDDLCKIRISYAHNSGSCNVDLSCDPFTQTSVMNISQWISSTVVHAKKVNWAGVIAASSDWAEGSWSKLRGYPSSLVFYQDRLVFAKTKSEPQTIWMSQTGDYSNFARSTPLVDSDGVSINLPSRKLNGIKNLIALGEILALTSATEWSVGPSGGGSITPTSIETKCQGYRGCSGVDPVIIGNRAVFVQPMGSVLRDLGYDYSVNGFSGDDLSVFANHLFESHKIVEMAYQQEPDSLVWCIRDDGVMLSMTYLREQEILAWTWHETDGDVESICTIPGDGHNVVWLVVNRGGVRFIEMMDKRLKSLDVAEQFFVDCGITYRGEPTSVVTGLAHLEGKTVAILADGNVMAQQVVTSGSITLPSPYSIVHVGLPYESDCATLNIEVSQQDGTMQGRLMKVSQVVVRFLNSLGGWLGPDENSLYEIVQRTNEPLDTAVPLFTGDEKVVLDSSYETGGTIFYRQKDPLPVTILAVMPTVSPGG